MGEDLEEVLGEMEDREGGGVELYDIVLFTVIVVKDVLVLLSTYTQCLIVLLRILWAETPMSKPIERSSGGNTFGANSAS